MRRSGDLTVGANADLATVFLSKNYLMFLIGRLLLLLLLLLPVQLLLLPLRASMMLCWRDAG